MQQIYNDQLQQGVQQPAAQLQQECATPSSPAAAQLQPYSYNPAATTQQPSFSRNMCKTQQLGTVVVSRTAGKAGKQVAAAAVAPK
jgi:hypothetical protein